MKKFRIERTEIHTRVWIIDAIDEDDALERYSEEDDDEEKSYYSGWPDVRVTEMESNTE